MDDPMPVECEPPHLPGDPMTDADPRSDRPADPRPDRSADRPSTAPSLACLAACLLALAPPRLPAAAAAAMSTGRSEAAASSASSAAEMGRGGKARSLIPAPQRAGAVATGHAQATAAGLEALRLGGNAVDAAVAAALALAVVYPEAGNLGGGGFAVVRMVGNGGEIRALDFRETAPAAAVRGMFLDAAGAPRPDASRVGPLAAGVPGSPRGLYELHEMYGSLPWPQVVAPAIRLARDGFAIDEHLHDTLAGEDQRQLIGAFPESAGVWLPGGQPPPAGTRMTLPALAASLAAYAQRGPAALTEGPVAAAVAAASRAHGGLLDAADLGAYRPVWRQALTFGAFGWQFATMPLPSAGGVVLGQTLSMLERRGWAALPAAGADRPYFLVEAFRRSFADRILLGDPATSRATPAELLDPHWIAQRAASIDPERATPFTSLQPWPGEAAPAARHGGETTHLSIVDGEGNAVALTTTLNGLFGCGLFVPALGFLNNEMDDFAAAPAAPGWSAAGGAAALPQGEANAVAAGKRMLSSMTPTIAWNGGEVIAVGGRGSLRIPTHTAQVLLDLLIDHQGLQPAVDRPRLHHQGLPDRLEAEPGALSDEVARELTRRGHHVVAPKPAESARVNAVRRRADGTFEAAVDPRGAAEVGGQGILAPHN
jgi:gamma-glutamyltranspeptidase/glutathione hydrolase